MYSKDPGHPPGHGESEAHWNSYQPQWINLRWQCYHRTQLLCESAWSGGVDNATACKYSLRAHIDLQVHISFAEYSTCTIGSCLIQVSVITVNILLFTTSGCPECLQAAAGEDQASQGKASRGKLEGVGPDLWVSKGGLISKVLVSL